MPFISQIATLPRRVLPQEITHAVGVEIADADDAPVGRHIGDERTVRIQHGAPFISQIATLPLVSCHNRSALPSPLKSRWATIAHWPGTLPTNELFWLRTVVPLISQSTVLPEVSRHAMSLKPSPLKLCVVRGLNWKTVPHPLEPLTHWANEPPLRFTP